MPSGLLINCCINRPITKPIARKHWAVGLWAKKKKKVHRAFDNCSSLAKSLRNKQVQDRLLKCNTKILSKFCLCTIIWNTNKIRPRANDKFEKFFDLFKSLITELKTRKIILVW